MRTMLLLLLLPCMAQAQINHSAKELASENIKDYISHKMFREGVYKPLYYGDLQQCRRKDDITWTLEHKFEVITPPLIPQKDTEATAFYRFIFYMDKKMQIKQVEAIQE